MCGIIGYIGGKPSERILLEGLKKLEYRGYDSAGIAVCSDQGLKVVKAKGRIAELENKLRSQDMPSATIGIGHTRWATHGKPSDLNSHPHTDTHMKISVVHNGIIENYMELRDELAAQGARFVSETDTEVVSHLIASLYEGDIVQAVQRATKRMRGAYALAVLSELEPDKLIAVRLHSPLIIGIGEGEHFIGSDIPAILEHTRDVYILDDGEMAVLTREEATLMTIEGNLITKQLFRVNWDLAVAEKAGYDHFMLKEIHDQPQAYRDTLSGRLFKGYPWVYLPELKLTPEQIKQFRNIHIVACGTAYHAGLVGKTAIERWARLPVEAEVASEYRYRSPLITPETLVIVVSQSGETADTLAALREAKRHGARVLAVTNVVGSTAAREADDVLFTWAGPEISVASTKAYSTQLLAFYAFAIHLARIRGTLPDEEIGPIVHALTKLPEQVESILQRKDEIKSYAEEIASREHLFFIGRGVDYAVVQEGSLKLKEISYIHSEAYAAGELKHGTLALIEEGTPVVALATQPDLYEKTVSNIREVMARGAGVLGIATEETAGLAGSVDRLLLIPSTHPMIAPALTVIPLQLLAYYASVARGYDVDKPRNLAKSVTVE
ncbi:glutamine--fructose-6-phosphate transaminase (isomerizing) [Cohnella xylanilytica]|uniref:Glutamine--fructose-6-phosphate aminotransferase [isomerizing] n=1 Tax=Cohnella xylanilytica TaxID=557555 RepID=A0A841U6B2_9BACL|nr:glutamine--fructose-6-phosphate transaminase (isomerizing) [Cohnella xylanilytica]MBB6695359.1 glutamine--fructose-6-phosphate transaminase (isomerizing) [Cohnella xylanilytica]